MFAFKKCQSLCIFHLVGDNRRLGLRDWAQNFLTVFIPYKVNNKCCEGIVLNNIYYRPVHLPWSQRIFWTNSILFLNRKEVQSSLTPLAKAVSITPPQTHETCGGCWKSLSSFLPQAKKIRLTLYMYTRELTLYKLYRIFKYSGHY